jgi:hypothetical protein
MVVLPKKLKYKQEIFGAIIKAYSDSTIVEIHYREIWRRVNEALGREVSFRDFQAHIRYMEDENLLKRRDPGGRGHMVRFSLTSRAKRMESFKILGIDESFKNRKKIYQLLLFFKLFKRRNPITQRKLYRFLEQIGTSEKALEVVKTTEKITHFKPVKGVEIIKWIQDDSRMNHTASVYHIAIPGFTVNEFISYLKKLKKGKEPKGFEYVLKGFEYDAYITNVHLIADVNISNSEITDAIKTFTDNDLIRPINEVFSGETRYDIVDKTLIKFLNDVWMVHDMDLRLLFERIVYCDEIKDEDENTLKLMYGKKVAGRILAIAYHSRKRTKDQRFKDEEKASRKFIDIWLKHRMSLAQNIPKRHQKVIEDYEIISDLIDGICYPSFLSSKK